MNKKGFTLVELLSVLVLLGMIIGIAVPGVMRANKKAKEKTLLTKVKNIEKAAVLYGQDNRDKFDEKCTINLIDYNECMHIITVDDLIIEEQTLNKDTNEWEITKQSYISFDDNKNIECYKDSDTFSCENGQINKKIIKGNILNPLDEKKYLNNCKIQIYRKYGKIYAVYLNKNNTIDTDMTQCWKG